jgi:hypothetical protein
VVFGEKAAYGLAVDLARGEVDETLVVLGAVLGLHARKASASAGVLVVNKAERMDGRGNYEQTTGSASMKLL